MRTISRLLVPVQAWMLASSACAATPDSQDADRLAQRIGSGLVLRMDRNLPNWPRQMSEPMSPNDLADEETALNHKIDLLEKQLASLQTRYQELNQDSPAATDPAPHNWLQAAAPPLWSYFAAGFLLLGGGTAWALQRRKTQHSLEAIHSDDSLIEPPKKEQVNPSSKLITPDIHSRLNQDVQICLENGNPKLAIDLLENIIEHEPTASAVPWLQLFDLLQREGLVNQYEKTRQKSRRHLNLYIPPFGGIALPTAKSGIESYPHVLAELVRVWPGEKALPYLSDLLHNTRAGLRAGFDAVTYNEIVLLQSIRENLEQT